MIWQALIPVIGGILEKVLPDPQAAADAKIKLLDLAQRGELAVLDAETKLALGQLEVNKTEAGTDMFRGGWRPATGWACVFGLVYQFLVQPLLPWLLAVLGVSVPPLPPSPACWAWVACAHGSASKARLKTSGRHRPQETPSTTCPGSPAASSTPAS